MGRNGIAIIGQGAKYLFLLQSRPSSRREDLGFLGPRYRIDGDPFIRVREAQISSVVTSGHLLDAQKARVGVKVGKLLSLRVMQVEYSLLRPTAVKSTGRETTEYRDKVDS